MPAQVFSFSHSKFWQKHFKTLDKSPPTYLCQSRWRRLACMDAEGSSWIFFGTIDKRQTLQRYSNKYSHVKSNIFPRCDEIFMHSFSLNLCYRTYSCSALECVVRGELDTFRYSRYSTKKIGRKLVFIEGILVYLRIIQAFIWSLVYL